MKVYYEAIEHIVMVSYDSDEERLEDIEKRKKEGFIVDRQHFNSELEKIIVTFSKQHG